MARSSILVFVLLGCGAQGPPTDYLSDPEMQGDRAFSIVASCTADTVCIPECENHSIDNVCGDGLPPAQGGCWITGGGFIVDDDGHDSFGGNGMPMRNGTIRGEWQHVDHGTGNKFHGQVRYLVCRHVDEPGPGQPSGPHHDFNMNQVYYGGPGRWFTAGGGGWEDGYWFDVFAEDHGEPGNRPGPGNHGSSGPDEYFFSVRKMVGDGQSGMVVYQTGNPITGGNLQIHPPNNGHPFTEGTLPAWVNFQP